MPAAERVRAVLDTNLIVRAVLAPRGVAGRIFDAFRAGTFELVTSPTLLDELVRVLFGRSVQRVLSLSPDSAGRLRAEIERKAMVTLGRYQDVRVVPADPTDDVLFACALEGRATYIVSGDEDHVRPVKAWKPYEVAIQVVGAPCFVRGVLGLPPPPSRS